MSKLKVGDVVRLTDETFKMFNGFNTYELVEQSKKMTITYIDDESLTSPEKSYRIEVDQPDMNQLFLLDVMVELITPAQTQDADDMFEDKQCYDPQYEQATEEADENPF